MVSHCVCLKTANARIPHERRLPVSTAPDCVISALGRPSILSPRCVHVIRISHIWSYVVQRHESVDVCNKEEVCSL